MQIQLKWKVTACVVGDGVGAMEVPSAQSLAVTDQGPNPPATPVVVPGGPFTPTNLPTAAQLETAATAVGTAVGVQLADALAQIQGWPSGNG